MNIKNIITSTLAIIFFTGGISPPLQAAPFESSKETREKINEVKEHAKDKSRETKKKN